MSSSMDVGSEKVCYIPCNFCNITLAVSVPCNNLLDMVTVRCGHCTHLWSVNMATGLHSISSWPQIQAPSFPLPDYRFDSPSSSRCNKANFYHPVSAINKNEGRISLNRHTEKRQRVPSAYNQFIKEEIQRIKANNPKISHREAFSTAAKNWAHFPHTHFGLMLDTNDQQN